MKTTLVPIHFACNDPDNGLFAGRVQMADFRGNDLEADWDGFTFTELDGAIRLHRRVFSFVARREWIGNWCWNAYWFTWPEAKRLLLTMRWEGWQCTGGIVRFTDIFDRAPERRRQAA